MAQEISLTNQSPRSVTSGGSTSGRRFLSTVRRTHGAEVTFNELLLSGLKRTGSIGVPLETRTQIHARPYGSVYAGMGSPVKLFREVIRARASDFE